MYQLTWASIVFTTAICLDGLRQHTLVQLRLNPTIHALTTQATQSKLLALKCYMEQDVTVCPT